MNLRRRLYSILWNAKQRCQNPLTVNYKLYGGRGIRVLITIEQLEKMWKRDQAHLLQRPSLDRKNRDKSYTMRNCRFIEISENSRRHHRTIKNKTPCFSMKILKEKYFN